MSHGTVMLEIPRSSATMGAKRKIISVSLSATWESVK